MTLLQGKIFSVQMEEEKKREVKELIESHGGVVSEGKGDYILTTEDLASKISATQALIVDEEFLKACVKENSIVSHNDYLLPKSAKRSAPTDEDQTEVKKPKIDSENDDEEDEKEEEEGKDEKGEKEEKGEEEEGEREGEGTGVEQIVNKFQHKVKSCLVPTFIDGEGDVLGSKIGGLPYLTSADEEWPSTGSYHMNFFFQIDIATLPNEFKKIFGVEKGLFQFFKGDDTESGWQAWDNSTLTRVVQVDGPGKVLAIPESEFLITPRTITSWDVKQDYPSAEDDDEEILSNFDDDDIDVYHDKYTVRGDKLGGWPIWIQGARYPQCKECQTEMTMVFQVESGRMCDFTWDINIDLGDSGNCHIFQCPTHKHLMTTTADCS